MQLLGLEEGVLHQYLAYIEWYAQPAPLVEALLTALLQSVSGLWAAVTLLLLPAPYGRYSTPKGWGPLVEARMAWVLMETPNLYLSALLYHYGDPKATGSLANRVLLGCFVLHYINRSLIYPLRMRAGKPMPLSVMLMAWGFCIYNSYLQARYLTALHIPQPDGSEWLKQPRVLVGLSTFFLGMFLNMQADAILRNLRRPGEEGYKIPRGGLFELVSGANFLGEIVEWTGFAIACWSLPSFAFALFTALNIGPRSVQHHKWYLEKFKDEYPAHRKALIPYLL